MYKRQGKELFAQASHNDGPRRNRPFVAINCGAIPKELLASELFGYEEGAFTGAQKGGRPGKFELADTGTLFLDEIGDMPFDMQDVYKRQEEGRPPAGGRKTFPRSSACYLLPVRPRSVRTLFISAYFSLSCFIHASPVE